MRVNEEPVVSIIMPVYNSEIYVEKSIYSVLRQTYKNFELIIVNDGSNDGSAVLLENIKKNDSRIIVLHTQNKGPSAARNTGLRYAHGTWVQFMDSDDVIDSGMLETLINNAENLDMVVSGAVFENHICNKSEKKELRSALLLGKKQIAEYLKGVNHDEYELFLNYLWNRLIRRTVIVNNNISFNEDVRLGEDYLFMCQILKSTEKIRVLEDAYYHYICRGINSLTNRFDINEAKRRDLVYQASRDLISHFGIDDKLKSFTDEVEGKYSFYSILRVRSAGNDISFMKKIEYIRSLLEIERVGNMLSYLTSQHTVKSSIQLLIIKTRNPYIIYFSIKIIMCLSNRTKKRLKIDE